MTVRDSDVRLRGQSGHPLGLDECLLMTQLRHSVLRIVATQNKRLDPIPPVVIPCCNRVIPMPIPHKP